jgi:SAM-dependent methyltransferase
MYENLYDIIREGCQSSAREVMTWLAGEYRLPRCLDVGCGEGWWAYWAKKSGLSEYAIGMDNDGFDSPCRADLDEWNKFDLASPEYTFRGKQFDLTICLEVAEHLPEHLADTLVRFLCDSSQELILFSAAIPGQGGMGHINEQWPSYWIHKFNDLGWSSVHLGFDFWENQSVEPWYKQNMYLLAKNGSTLRQEDLTAKIHPAFWATRTGVAYP